MFQHRILPSCSTALRCVRRRPTRCCGNLHSIWSSVMLARGSARLAPEIAMHFRGTSECGGARLHAAPARGVAATWLPCIIKLPEAQPRNARSLVQSLLYQISWSMSPRDGRLAFDVPSVP